MWSSCFVTQNDLSNVYFTQQSHVVHIGGASADNAAAGVCGQYCGGGGYFALCLAVE